MVDLKPLAGAIGTEVAGLDVSRPLAEADDALLRHTLADRGLVVLRDQHLTPERQVELTRLFGDTVRMPYIGTLPGYPDIIPVLKEADERDIAVFGGDWHSDFSYLERPPAGSLLYALEVPDYGGDTLWADMTAAYAALSDGMKRLLAGRRAMHSGWIYGARHAPKTARTPRSVEISRGNTEADVERAQPIVRRHPVSGRPALFVNPIYTTRLEGMTVAESRPLLDMLYRHARAPEFCCRLRWTPGTLAIWDNRSTLHYAVNDYDGHRRLLHRTTFAGELPIAA
jgi:taurine dioxygenase